MTRDDLIEALAKACEVYVEGGASWAEVIAPVVVEFVAGWLETVPLRYEPEPRAWELARKWREEMGA
jgi:hypothetical protein